MNLIDGIPGDSRFPRQPAVTRGTEPYTNIRDTAARSDLQDSQ